MTSYDVAIVGGGHNGLVCAGYLARAGLSVVVLEGGDRLGGPVARREFLPGYFCSFSNSPGSTEPRIIRDLELERFGLVFKTQDPTLVHPLEDGRIFVAWRDRARTAAQLEAFAAGESQRYDLMFQFLQDLAERIGISLFRPPPSLQELTRNLTTLADQEAFSRIFFGSVRDLFEEFALAWETKSLLGPISTVGGLASPATPGTPISLMMRPFSLASIAESDGMDDPRRLPLRGSTGLPVGGMGAITEAMAASARAHGAVLRTEAPVARVLVRNGVARGVATRAGEEIHASIVVAAVHPRVTVQQLMDGDPDWRELQAKMARKRWAGKSYKLVLALERMPRWAAARDDEAAALAGAQFRVAPTLEYLEEAHTDMLLGRPTLKPVLWGLCPSVGVPELAPPGRHVMSLNIGNAPYHLRGSNWRDERDHLAKRCIDLLARWMPELPNMISDWRCIDPQEVEATLGLVEANITQGDMLPWNQFWMRPLPGLHDYRTPTRGLYLSGVGTWPGNYVSGIPGHNTSQAVLADLRARRIAVASRSQVAVGAAEARGA